MIATTETIEISDVRRELDVLFERVHRGETRLLVERGGKPIAMILSPEDYARLARLERDREARFAILDEMQAAFAGVSEEEIERETAKALAEVRAEMRAEREQLSTIR